MEPACGRTNFVSGCKVAEAKATLLLALFEDRLAMRNTNDGKPWSEVDIYELRHALAWGGSVEEAARLLDRSGTPSEVKLKAKELGLLSATDEPIPTNTCWPGDA
jgi:hypothetical protein